LYPFQELEIVVAVPRHHFISEGPKVRMKIGDRDSKRIPPCEVCALRIEFEARIPLSHPVKRCSHQEATMILFTTRSVQRAVALALLGSLNLYAQPTPYSNPSSQTRMLVEPGPHQRVWQMVATNLMGRTANELDTGRRVAEITTGMNYWDGRQWVPSDPSFEVTADAFVATRLQYKVHLNANLNRVGAVTVTSRDGITLRSTPVGIGLYDAASGRSAARLMSSSSTSREASSPHCRSSKTSATRPRSVSASR